jgi:hypothetical protein
MRKNIRHPQASPSGLALALPEAPPDLQTQFEALLDQVWRSEHEWELDDRIDLALHVAPAC